MTLFRITSPYFCAGVEPGKMAASIIQYMIKWKEEEIREYCRKKGWIVEELIIPTSGENHLSSLYSPSRSLSSPSLPSTKSKVLQQNRSTIKCNSSSYTLLSTPHFQLSQGSKLTSL